MTDYALTNFALLTGNQDLPVKETAVIIIRNNKIAYAGPARPIPEDCQTVDLGGLTLCPGFIDLQLNGCGGVLFNDDISAATLNRMHATNLRSGCTTFLPTLITCSDDDMKKAVAVVKAYREQHPERVPGIHLEGPYFNKARKGIHNESLIRPPSEEMIDYLCANADAIAMITLAPEVCSDASITRLSQSGIIVSLGHTNATLEQVRRAEKAGASFVTHLFNGMSQLQSREPGVVGATFSSSSLSAGIIADGYHLHWHNLLLSRQLLHDRLILVTDATPAAGSDIEQFEFGGQTVYHQDGKCTGEDGTLGGSALTMIEAVSNSVSQGIPRQDAVRMATTNPARVLGMEQYLGDIRQGGYANLVIMDDTFTIHGSVSNGQLLFTGPLITPR